MASQDPILTISVASRLLGLHSRTLMLYEKMGLIKPHRTGTQRRMFTIEDLGHLQFIKYLTQERGVNLQGVKIILEAIEMARNGNVNLKNLLFTNFKVKNLI